MAHYARYQYGRGIGEIDIYRGPKHKYSRQSGRGIGTYFSQAIRYLKPYISSGLKALKEQGLESSGAILNQLGEKKLKVILEEEGQRALKNLKRKAINKLNSSYNKNIQTGTGLPMKLNALKSALNIYSMNPKKRVIKRKGKVKKTQKDKIRRVGGVGQSKKKRKQIGGSRKKKSKASKKKQTGGKKKKTKKKKKKPIARKQLDIFD